LIDAKPWIEHLSEPLVLAGFGLFIFATLAAVLLKQRRIVSANAKLAVMMSFALALIIVVGGVWLAGKKTEPGQVQTPPPALEQKTDGAQSPAVSSGKDVHIQYVAPVPPQKPSSPAGTSSTGNMPVPPAQKSPSNASQETKGDQSPAVQSGGDVNIQYGAKP